MRTLTRTRDLVGLGVFIAVCLGAGALGGIATASSVGDWYQTLQKPSFNPPDWIFAPVWTALYLMMAVAAWRVWRSASDDRHRALTVFGVQLVLNVAWSILFFGFRRVDLAMVEICFLLVAIVATAELFRRIDRPAGALLVPYGLWVAFATVLTISLWRLNPLT